MKDIQTEKFVIQANALSKEEQIELKNILRIIKIAHTISDINSSPLVGFPYLHTIEFGKYVIGLQVKNNEVELAGIVEKGKEMGLFF